MRACCSLHSSEHISEKLESNDINNHAQKLIIISNLQDSGSFFDLMCTEMGINVCGHYHRYFNLMICQSIISAASTRCWSTVHPKIWTMILFSSNHHLIHEWYISKRHVIFQPYPTAENIRYSISQEICTRLLLCCALLWLNIDWFSHIHQAYFTGTVAF